MSVFFVVVVLFDEFGRQVRHCCIIHKSMMGTKWNMEPSPLLFSPLTGFAERAAQLELLPAGPSAALDYPSHIHIDLMEGAQGQGIGVRMIKTILATLKAKGSLEEFSG